VNLLLDRSAYDDHSTVGDLYVDGVWECITLEDGIQPNDVKVDGETCIPDGTYPVKLTPSPKFGRKLPLLIDVPGFDGIRIHPGNTVGDTSGCVLVGENMDNIVPYKPFLIHSKAAFDRLYAKLDAADERGETITIEVRA